MRCDIDGNLWCGWGMGEPELDGVMVFAPDGTPIGRIALPERCANVCFGGLKRNRLFMAASQSRLCAVRQHARRARRVKTRLWRFFFVGTNILTRMGFECRRLDDHTHAARRVDHPSVVEQEAPLFAPLDFFPTLTPECWRRICPGCSRPISIRHGTRALHPELHRADAAPHYSDRHLRRQSQAAPGAARSGT